MSTSKCALLYNYWSVAPSPPPARGLLDPGPCLLLPFAPPAPVPGCLCRGAPGLLKGRVTGWELPGAGDSCAPAMPPH